MSKHKETFEFKKATLDDLTSIQTLTNDLFESTVNWYSLPSAGTGVCDPLLTSLNSTTFDYESQQSL